MKPGRASQTAVLVCMARAAAHGTYEALGFADPTALMLLPDNARAEVERFRAGTVPKGLRARFDRLQLRTRSHMMIVRTVEIDAAVRAAASPQLVILGAGLDGRAWRMPELSDVVVFEVDHPDSQRDKRLHVSALTELARDVRFVPVDFARDNLDKALAAAGHDEARPTTWIWEGVVMYLALADVEATLRVIERRSTPQSRLVVAYHSPAPILRLVGWIVRRLGEPLRSSFTSEAMRVLLGKYGFEVVRDQELPAIAARMSADLAQSTRFVKHVRIATADRVADVGIRA